LGVPPGAPTPPEGRRDDFGDAIPPL
jgi:hypothetical protein